MRAKRYMLIGLAFYLTYVGGASYYYVVSFPARVMHHVFITLLLAVWLFGRLRQQRGLPESGINPLLYASIAVWALGAILGLSARVSLEWLWFGLIHTLFFLYIVEQIRRGYQRLVMEAVFFMAMGVLLLSGLELYSWFTGQGFIPVAAGWIVTGQFPRLTDFPQIALPMAVSTLVAGYTAPLVMVTGIWAATTNQRAARVILGVMAVLLAGVLLLTSSRGGALSLGAAVGTLILMRLVQHPRVRAAVPLPMLVAGAMGVVAIGLAGVVYVSWPNSNNISNRDRLLMWQSALSVTAQDPLTGVGIGQFGHAFRALRNPFLAQDKLASAHNFYLNVLAETGLPGLLLCGLLGIAIAQQGWRHWRAAPNRGTRIRIEGVFAALAGIAVHSLVEVFTTTPMVLLIVALVAYGITPQPRSRLDSVTPGARRPAWIALGLVLFYGVWLLWQDYAQASSIRAWELNNPAEARTAQAIDPALTLYQLQEAYLVGQTGTPEEGIAAYQSALIVEPTWDVGWLNLAALQEQTGHLQEAVESLRRAEQLRIDNGSAVHLGRIGEELGWPNDESLSHYRSALEASVMALTIDHDGFYVLPLADFWHETPLRLQALEEVTPTMPVDWAYRVWAAHDPARLGDMIPATPFSAAEWWIVGEYALTVEQDAPKAVNAFTQAITLMPRKGDYYASRARALLSADPDATLHDLDLARVYGTQFEYPNAIEALITDDPNERESLQIEAVPLRNLSQGFAAVLYGRTAFFEITPLMRDPGYGMAALQPWLELLAKARQEGDTEFAASLEEAIHFFAPYTQIP